MSNTALPPLTKELSYWITAEIPKVAACLSGQGDAICGMKDSHNVIATGQGESGRLPQEHCHLRFSLKPQSRFLAPRLISHLLMRTPTGAHTAGLAFIISGPAELFSLTVVLMSVLTAVMYIDSCADSQRMCHC